MLLFCYSSLIHGLHSRLHKQRVQWLIKDVKKLPPKEMGARLRMCSKGSLKPRSDVKATKILIERDPHRMLHLACQWLCWDWLCWRIGCRGWTPKYLNLIDKVSLFCSLVRVFWVLKLSFKKIRTEQGEGLVSSHFRQLNKMLNYGFKIYRLALQDATSCFQCFLADAGSFLLGPSITAEHELAQCQKPKTFVILFKANENVPVLKVDFSFQT